MSSSTARQARRRSAKLETAFNSALQKHQAGELSRAGAAYRRIIAAEPNHFGALINLGLMAFHAGDYDSAVTFIGRAARIEPDNASARYNLGSALSNLGRLDDAATEFTTALELDPDHAAALFNLGNTLRLQGKLDPAIAACERAIELAPDIPEAHNNLGCALQEQGKLDAAIAAFQEAIRLNPNYATAFFNLGTANHAQGIDDEANPALQEAVRLDPDYAEAHKLLSDVFYRQGRFDLATSALDKVFALNAGDHSDFVRRAQIRLAEADFEGGWSDYLMRPNVGGLSPVIARQRLSSNLSGKRVFVLSEQGLGDEIFFLRFVAILKDMGAWIAYRPDPRIACMLERLPFIDQVIGEHEQPDAIDHTYVAGDLPFILGMNSIADIPPSIELPVAEERADAMIARLLALGPAPYFGVTWRAGTGVKGFLSKQTPAERIGATLRSTAGTVVVVQRNPDAEDRRRFDRALGRPSHDLSVLNDDLEAMLALMDSLDDYICVSNTNVHLRTACGHTCRVLIPIPPDFRWMASSPDSPWFPGTQLYRECREGGWDGAYEKLAADLMERYPTGRG